MEEEEKKKEKKSQLAASALQTPQFKIIAGALSSEDNYKLENQVLHPKAYITPHYEEQAKSTRDRYVKIIIALKKKKYFILKYTFGFLLEKYHR